MFLLKLIVESLWYFLPVLIASQFIGFFRKINLPLMAKPINKNWFGQNKTWGAYYAGAIGAILAIYLQRQIPAWNSAIGLFDYSRNDLWLVGLRFGVGAVLGDHIKSFIKRRRGIYPGVSWFPWDQIDATVGGIILASPMTGWMGTSLIDWVAWVRYLF